MARKMDYAHNLTITEDTNSNEEERWANINTVEGNKEEKKGKRQMWMSGVADLQRSMND